MNLGTILLYKQVLEHRSDSVQVHMLMIVDFGICSVVTLQTSALMDHRYQVGT